MKLWVPGHFAHKIVLAHVEAYILSIWCVFEKSATDADQALFHKIGELQRSRTVQVRGQPGRVCRSRT